jgi:hypothetical protein
MRKLIIATTALAFLSSLALVPSVAVAQEKAAADTTKSDTAMSKKPKKAKKSAKKTGDDTMQKQ